MITKKLQDQLRVKYNPDGSVNRLAQLRMVEMLKFLDTFCAKHSVKYWIDCGTLLGAIRHGGFIPWDDDVDVCMMRKDYVRFVKAFGNRQYGDFVLQTPQTDNGFYRFWSVIRDVKTECIKGDDNPCELMLNYRGLQVDVFPVIDRYTNFSWIISKSISWRIKHYYSLEAEKKASHINTKLLFRMGRYIIFPLLRILFRKKHDCLICDYGVGFYEEKRNIKNIFPLSRISFENITLYAPKDPIAHCKLLYGDDCMEIPNKDKIYDHHSYVVFK